MSKTAKQRVGNLGEDIACKFLIKHGYSIIDRNYWKKWGEIDIIAKKSKKLYFIEVKSVSCENMEYVSRETDEYRPEENVHPKKLERLSRTIQSYLLERDLEEQEWQLDIITVLLDTKHKKAKIKRIEDIVF